MSETDCSGCGNLSMLGLKAMQHEALEGVARDLPLPTIMNRLCLQAERLAPHAICSILSVDAMGKLHPVAAPSLPDDFSAAIDGLQIGPSVGSCGTAAYFGKTVEVTDIATNPLWADFKDLALPLGLRACWSSPIRASDGRVIGAFAFYYRTCRGPSALDHTIVEACVNLCAIALEQEERKASIHRLAYFDPLTGVANRTSFEKHGRDAVSAAGKGDAGLAIHCIDLDLFKSVNDTLGHQAGDAALQIIAQRIAAALRSGEFLARIGGDEFVVFQRGACREEIEALARRLVAVTSEPVDLGSGNRASIGGSVGVACAPQDGATLPELMKKADLALYEAKLNGRQRFCFFDEEIEARVASRWQLEQDLKQALGRQEFELHFQPIVELAGIELAGFEVLLRWRRPGHGLLSPLHFLDAAEKMGLIGDIGAWVLKEACAIGASLPQSLRIAVNLSPTQLLRPGFPLEVAKAVAETQFSPRRLELEITESALLLENSATLACLNDLRRLGISIALDDFGTGFSALSHLRVFPVDRIKIDRSFVQEVDRSPETASIIRAILGLARELGVKSTAEGIETPSQLRMLRKLGCDEIQGYLVSRPKPYGAFRNLTETPPGGSLPAKSA
jgi:diguanylate cyclase (GGDEF)-like protein